MTTPPRRPYSVLLSQTLALLDKTPATLREVADATGLSYDWLRSLKSGRIDDPGVSRVEALFRYLTMRAEAKQ